MSAPLDVLTFGEAMMSLRAPCALSAGAGLTASVAGAESNVAIALARLGHAAAWAGRVGDDEAGRLVVRTLRGEGVEVRCEVGGEPTGVMVRRERLPGVVAVDYHRRGSAGAALAPEQLRAQLADGDAPRWLHCTGITPALSDSARGAATAVVETARAHGVRVSLDLNHRPRLWSAEAAREALSPLARLADVVVASEDELPLVAQGPEELLVAGVTLVAVKRGKAGAVLHARDEVVEKAAVRVTSVDAVGAGDAFCAGLLSGLLDGLGHEACLERAVTLGAFAVASVGDWEGLPTRAELHLLSSEHGSVLR